MSAVTDDDLVSAIVSSPWERLETMCRVHSEALADLDDARTEENLAVVDVVESILAAMRAR